MPEEVVIPNPFSQSIVNDAWQEAPADVPEIHAQAFELCCDLLGHVRRGTGSRSILLHGQAGSGKTHLLARLRRQWVSEAAEASSLARPPEPPQVLLTSVRLRAGPRMICRHLRRTLAGDLFRPSLYGLTQLERLLLHRLSQYLPNPKKAWKWWQTLHEPLRERKWWETFRRPEGLDELEKYFDQLMERLDEDLDLGRNLTTVLRHLISGRHRRDTRDWLREGALPETAMQNLELVPDPSEEDPEEQAIDFICALSRLAGPDVPLVLCFDQVEALQAHPGDYEGLFSFGRMVSALHDKTSTLLMISCVQSSFLDSLQEAIRGADMDRLAEWEGLLRPLTWRESEALAAARLEGSDALAEEREAQGDLLWPLQAGRLYQFMQSAGTCTPRQFIAFCSDEFERWRQGQAEPVLSMEEYLVQQYETELTEALERGGPRYTDDILAHGLPLLMETTGQGRQNLEQVPKGVDLAFRMSKGERYFSFCNQNGILLTMRLKRLYDQIQKGALPHVVVIRDSRLPVSRQAIRARDYLDALLAHKGVVIVRPSALALAALDAFRRLLSDAKAGDLAHRGEGISAEAVQEWMASHLPGALVELLEAIFPEGPSSAGDVIYDALLELVQHSRLIRLTDAAHALGRSAEELDACLERFPDQFGVLRGPPKVVFDLAFEGVED